MTTLPQVPLAAFLDRLILVLPKLIELAATSEVQDHPVWGTVIPYHISHYGTGDSLGFCIRPDILLTCSGPKICELDFVPSGRGFLLAGLTSSEERKKFLDPFAWWYQAMGAERVLYATASTTVCRPETELFSRMLRELCGTDIRAGNIDDYAENSLDRTLVDRLFYRSEMAIPEDRKSLPGVNVSTAEPYLDSKALFALIHDGSLTRFLQGFLGEDTLTFLRSAFPETRLLSNIRKAADLEHIGNNRANYVIKNTDVETNHSWGCRGTVVGRKYNQNSFLKALRCEESPNGKDTGQHPILQRWSASRDFWQTWNGVVDGVHPRTRLMLEESLDPITTTHATKAVGARIGFYFLVVNATKETRVTPYGTLVLRQDDLLHGARDAICLPVSAY